MEDNNSNQVEPIGKIPRSKDNAFNLSQLSMREFEAFMILLMHEGEEQSILKKLIDLEFNHKSPTKGYDYINHLCRNKVLMETAGKPEIKYLSNKVLKETAGEPIIIRPAFAYKKKTTVKGKQVTGIYIRSTIRKKYERFILPTVSSLKKSLKDVFEEYIDDLKDVEKIHEKFKAYTETVLLSINNLLVNEPVKTLKSKRFQKKLYDTIWKIWKVEMLKYEMFSK